MADAASIAATRANIERGHAALALAVIVASGFAGLGYQIVWTQQSAVWLGHEAAAMLAVVAAFFGGLAVGAFAFAKHIDRSAAPARWYAACEATIGLWSLVLAFLLPRAAPVLLRLMGPQPTALTQAIVSFVGTLLLLAPATIAMGATLPAIERWFSNLQHRGVRIATLYAGNTLGAVLGVLASAFWLIPSYGLQRTASLCALLNFACAAIALIAFTHPAPRDAPTTARHPRLLALLAATGLLGIGYEVIVVRVLSQVAENTVYTFALVLAVYLFGTACGAALYARKQSARVDDAHHDRLLQLLVIACLAGIGGLSAAETIRDAVLTRIGTSMQAALLAETLLAVVAFLMPTMAMGALFSHLSTHARRLRSSFGAALGWNTMGAALAPILFGAWLMPRIGSTACLLLIVASYALLASTRAWTCPSQWALAITVIACVAWSPPLAFIHVPDQGRLLRRSEGALATVSVIEDASGTARLHINNRQQEGSSATIYADARQALLPLLLHDAPRRALFLGMGTGVTALSATLDPRVQVDVVELLPEVVAASEHFTKPLAGDFDRSRLHVMTGDARRFVRASGAPYDVVVSDNFHPARSGSGALYTLEHFEAVRARLGDHGLFCQWLPLHQLDLDTLRSIVKTYVTAFPRAWAVLATNSLDTPVVGLIGRNDADHFAVPAARARLQSLGPATGERYGIADEYALFGSFIADADALAQFAAGAPLNSDDLPIVIYRAPHITYAPTALPRDRLIELLHQVRIDAFALLEPGEIGIAPRLSAYWSARNRFIEIGRDVQPTNDVERMLAQVRDPLLQVLQLSPDFRPAYDPLLNMAQALASTDRDAARALLTELQRIQPARTEAATALNAISE